MDLHETCHTDNRIIKVNVIMLVLLFSPNARFHLAVNDEGVRWGAFHPSSYTR